MTVRVHSDYTCPYVYRAHRWLERTETDLDRRPFSLLEALEGFASENSEVHELRAVEADSREVRSDLLGGAEEPEEGRPGAQCTCHA